jgi:hypothetical protein
MADADQFYAEGYSDGYKAGINAPAQRALPETIEKVLLIAEGVVWYDWSNNDSDASHTMDQLRKAVIEARAAFSSTERTP